jgi:hypothetical protein
MILLWLLSRDPNYIIAVTADENHGGAFQFFCLNDIFFPTLLTKYNHLTDTCFRVPPKTMLSSARTKTPNTSLNMPKPGKSPANARP